MQPESRLDQTIDTHAHHDHLFPAWWMRSKSTDGVFHSPSTRSTIGEKGHRVRIIGAEPSLRMLSDQIFLDWMNCGFQASNLSIPSVSFSMCPCDDVNLNRRFEKPLIVQPPGMMPLPPLWQCLTHSPLRPAGRRSMDLKTAGP